MAGTPIHLLRDSTNVLVASLRSGGGNDAFTLVLIIFNKEFNVPNVPQQSQFLIYQTEDGRIKIDVRFEDESVWLTSADDGGFVPDF